jgi:YebC/PmpR family DNA-binding regulatory protein
MSGHSKWANIKRKKEKTDAQKGKIFTKLGREILVAVRSGGPDPENNSRLKDVIAKAKAANMPNDTIMRSIKKAAGESDSASYEEVTYEGYGPGGVAVIVNAMTDNRNRTAGDVRHLFDKYNGNLGTTGCVSFMFDKKGVIVIEKKDEIDEEELMMHSIEAGAEDFNVEEEYYEITTAPGDFSSVRESFAQKQSISFWSLQFTMNENASLNV